jgi:hypothetical protein
MEIQAIWGKKKDGMSEDDMKAICNGVTGRITIGQLNGDCKKTSNMINM